MEIKARVADHKNAITAGYVQYPVALLSKEANYGQENLTYL